MLHDRFRIAIADDHDAITRAFARIFMNDPRFDLIGVASDGVRALEIITELEPDAALIDYQMPRLNGIELARAITSRRSKTHVAILSGFEDEASVAEAKAAGASAFFAKTERVESVVNTLFELLARSERSFVSSRLSPSNDARDQVEENRARSVALSPRLREVLALFARGSVSDKDIAALLGIAPTTAAKYVSRLLALFGLGDRARLPAIAVAFFR